MTNAQLREADLSKALLDIVDPEIGRTLGQLEMLKEVRIDAQGAIHVEIDLPTPAYPHRERITQAIEKALGEAQLLPAGPPDVTFSSRVRGKNAGGTLGLSIANIIAVGSGKGGVGKSTIAACLAYGLHHFGARAGLMDADVYGPSIPHLLGVDGAKPAAIERKTPSGETFTRIEPVIAGGIKTISMGFFIDPAQAVVWRGPLLHRAILQFLKDTDWGPLDYLVIDLPPGTGDVALTLSQSVGLAGAVVVCTPQQVALLDAVKAISMYRQVKIPILGMVENMSGEIFGRGGARRKAAELGVPFLGEVPIDADIRIKGDEGKTAALFAEQSAARPHLLHVCEQTAIQVAKQLLESPSMPTLEIL
ncbi:MAG TPA: Mrp/NBP35 family ATP-binding protein [Planctomycetaceae bacterium]|jgi:ATP-binding protein involved in chromosome partitioning|nr:Mrp/NBP35 family ATP-binding protein [Planctomycetaceae bacterium]